MNKRIPIVFGVDDNFVPFTCVAINSILKNSSKEYFYDFYILYNSLSDESKKTLDIYITGNSNVNFLCVKDKIEKVKSKLCIRNHYSDAIYYRFFIPKLLPNYDKVIYIDADTVVLDDISKLYNVQLNRCLVGAVVDEVVLSSQLFIDYVQICLGVRCDKYFNSGVMLLNTRLLRNCMLEERFLSSLNQSCYEVAPDQDFLNVFCKNRVKYLDRGWNKMPITKQDVKGIKLIHYNLNFKPWRTDNVLYQEYFWQYAFSTPYYKKICDMKNNITKEEQLKIIEHEKNLVRLAESKIKSVNQSQTNYSGEPIYAI